MTSTCPFLDTWTDHTHSSYYIDGELPPSDPERGKERPWVTAFGWRRQEWTAIDFLTGWPKITASHIGCHDEVLWTTLWSIWIILKNGAFKTQRCKYKKFAFFTSVSCAQLPRLEGISCMLYTTIECIQKSATFMLYIALERPIRWYWFIQKAPIKTLFLLELFVMLVLCSPCIIESEPLQSCEHCSPIITQIQLLQQW